MNIKNIIFALLLSFSCMYSPTTIQASFCDMPCCDGCTDDFGDCWCWCCTCSNCECGGDTSDCMCSTCDPACLPCPCESGLECVNGFCYLDDADCECGVSTCDTCAPCCECGTT